MNNVDLTKADPQFLRELEAKLAAQYADVQAKGLKLDMARGKPGADQLDLSNASLGTMTEFKSAKGVDVRNYGILEGLPEMRAFFGEALGLDPESIIIGGNSSLNLMYDQMVRLLLFGTGGHPAWSTLPKRKFLCPSPGYDRHFAITEDLGFELIPVAMTATGPDMDQVESLVAGDPAVKGIWCVPLYSNPQGCCYDDRTVDRLAAMKTAAPDFRIFWDNAYGVHHLYGERKLKDIFAACNAAGNPDRAYYFFSTSKITFPGAGVSMMATSPTNRAEILKRMTIQTIGHDKINQLRTLRFLKDAAGLKAQMEKQAERLRPKFQVVAEALDRELAGTGLASWTDPKGGYFVALDTLPGCAKETVALAKAAGLTMTGAGATFPCHKDPKDTNIRIAPTYPGLEELKQAMELFTLCVKLAGVRKLLQK